MANGFETYLLSTDPPTRNAVQAALDRAPVGAKTAFADTPESLSSMLSRKAVPLVLVDVDSDSAPLLLQVERLVAQFRGTRFVLLCRKLDTQFVLQAMQAGARHCIEKARLAAELPGVAQRFLDEVPNHSHSQGKLVTVLSASGGSGATSIAINLAFEASDGRNMPTLIADLDLAYGSVATLLGVSARYGIADVLDQSGQGDPELVRSTATVHSEHLHVLVSPVSVDFSAPAAISFARLDTALEAMRRAYGFVVVDAPRVAMDVAATLVRSSDLTLVVFQQDVVDVRTVSSMIAALTDRHAPLDKLVALANRFQKRGSMLPLSDVAKALGPIEILTVRNDYESTLRSINYGQPLSKVASRSVIRKDLGEVLRRVELTEDAPTRQS
jgi:pilus assembly protein CpaE